MIDGSERSGESCAQNGGCVCNRSASCAGTSGTGLDPRLVRGYETRAVPKIDLKLTTAFPSRFAPDTDVFTSFSNFLTIHTI